MTALPSVVVVGAPKCGTTALHAYFAAHPDTHVHSESELHWWSRPELERHCAGPGDTRALRAVCPTKEAYGAAFAGARDGAVIVETSPSYLFWPEVADRLTSNVPDARIVVLVRDPARRAWSQYWHQVRAGVEPLDFDSALDAETSRSDSRWGDLWSYLGHSFYAAGVKRYQDRVGADRVLVLDAEELGSASTTHRLCSFVGISPATTSIDVVHRGGKPRSATLTAVASRIAPAARRVLPVSVRHRARDLLHRTTTTQLPELPAETAARLAAHFAADQHALARLRNRELQLDER